MKQYWCFIYVRYRKPLLVRANGSPDVFRAAGYWHRLGISATSVRDLKRQVENTVCDGKIVWDLSFYTAIRYYDLGLDPVPKGVWYFGGRAYLP
jgi:hypothetical protein